MRTVLRIIVLALVALGLTTFGAGPAQAGGPTSVLLVSPSTERTASFYNGSPEYQTLMALLDESSPEAGPAPAEEGDYLTVTWLIHDVQVWRIDRIHLGAEAGPWVSTTTTMEGPAGSAGDEIWHGVAAKPLVALLTSVGLLGPDTSLGAEDASGDTTQAAALEDVGLENAGSTEATLDATGSQTGPWWGLGGLVVGTAATFLVVRAKRATPAPEEVRQELVG